MTLADFEAGQRELTATVRVLVVDDVPDIRKLIRMTLERVGPFDVVGEAGDGQFAIAEAARLKPDIVLLDLSMPIMDGLEALPEILVASPESKVLVLSGFTAGEMGDEAIRLGAAGYMEKGGIVGKLGPRLRELVPFRVAPSPRPTDTSGPPTTSGDLFALLLRDVSRPLTVLHALASRLLRAEELPPEAVHSAMQAITREARRLQLLLDTFSDAGKLEVGGLDLTLVPTDVPQLLRELLDELTEITASHPVNVDVDEHVVVNVDPTRIRHVLMSLLSNAAKFSPLHTPIEVTTATDDAAFEVRVRDFCGGLSAEHRDRLFTKFGPGEREAAGPGLGLYISREIARAHGGDVFLANCDASGCVFALRLHLNR